MFKLLNFALLLTITTMVNAEEGFPVSCQPIAVMGDSVTLKTKPPSLVLVHNVSANDLWITHPVSDPSASAGWSSRLDTGNWSAIALDKDSFELSCIESKPGHEQQISCVGAIAVCDYTSVKMPAQSTGTFWAGENMALQALTASLGGRGFTLPLK